VFPELNDKSEELIIRFFVGTREAVGDKTDTVPITARTLEAAFRLATAHARMRLSNEITEEDARAAIKLLESNLKSVGIDPVTGELDADVLASGMTRSQASKLRKICSIIKELSESDYSQNHSAKLEEIITKCNSENINDAEEQIKKMARNGDLLCPEKGYYKVL